MQKRYVQFAERISLEGDSMKIIKILLMIFFGIPVAVFIVTVVIVHLISVNATGSSGRQLWNNCTTITLNQSEKYSCSFRSFEGTKQVSSFQLVQNQVLSIEYEFIIDKGNLELIVVDNNKNIIQKESIIENKKGNLNHIVTEAGKHTVELSSIGSDGKYTIKINK
jgi:hypothetical protein